MFDSDNDFGGVVRQNWPLLVAAGVLVCGAAFVYMRGESQAATPEEQLNSVMQQNAIRAASGDVRSQVTRKTTEDLAREQIAEHEAKVVADPEHENTPAYLMAMGNLYRQKLLDYESAIECYQRILRDHKDWNNVRLVYMQLATCYERLDDKESAQGVYQEMLDVFPEGTNEHDIAHAAVFQ